MPTQIQSPSASFPQGADVRIDTAGSRDRLLASVAEGRRSFVTKKSAGLYAVAHAAIVALAAASVSAPQHARRWLRDEINKANAGIAAKNSQRKADRDKGSASLKEKVNIESLEAEGAEDPVAELERLQALAELDEDEFKRGQFVKLKNYDDTEEVESTAVIRFVFELYERHDAPLVSRYAQVLDWIRARFGHLAEVDVEQIVSALQAAGGFEAVLQAQRQQNAPKGAGKRGGRKPEPADESVEGHEATSEFRAETLTVTMRMPPGVSELPLGLLRLYCIRKHPEEIQITVYEPMTEDEFAEITQTTRVGVSTSNPGAAGPLVEQVTQPEAPMVASESIVPSIAD